MIDDSYQNGLLRPRSKPLSLGVLGLAWWRTQPSRLKRDLISIAKQAHLLSLLIKRPEVPWPAKIAAGCSVAYVFSPIQLIPSFIPVIGQLDDLLVLFLGTKLARKFTPVAVLQDCEARAEYAFLKQAAKLDEIVSDLRRRSPLVD